VLLWIYFAQFSTASEGMRRNSRSLLVTRVTSSETACVPVAGAGIAGVDRKAEATTCARILRKRWRMRALRFFVGLKPHASTKRLRRETAVGESELQI